MKKREVLTEKRQFNINGRDMGMRSQGMGITDSSIDRMTLKASKSKAQGCPLFLATLGPGAPHISNPNGVQQGEAMCGPFCLTLSGSSSVFRLLTQGCTTFNPGLKCLTALRSMNDTGEREQQPDNYFRIKEFRANICQYF